jgi:hypothetical protein
MENSYKNLRNKYDPYYKERGTKEQQLKKEDRQEKKGGKD